MTKPTVDTGDDTLIERASWIAVIPAIVVPLSLMAVAAVLMLAHAEQVSGYIGFAPLPMGVLGGGSFLAIWLSRRRLMRWHPRRAVRAAAKRRGETTR